MKSRSSWVALIALVFSGLCCSVSHAAACSVSDATLTFGVYNPVSGTATTANASFTLSCSALLGFGNLATVSYTMLLSAGSSGSTANRKMLGGTVNLPYNIYTTGSFTTVWDGTTGVSDSLQLQGLLGLPIPVFGNKTDTAYGRILALQPSSVGSYTDSLTLTVIY